LLTGTPLQVPFLVLPFALSANLVFSH
jgi:hypothetical protein